MPRASSSMNVLHLKHRDALVLGIATFLGVFALDRLTSDEFSLTALYLLPVLLIGWNSGRSWGLAFAILSVAAQGGQTPLNASHYTKALYLYIAYANVFLEYVIMVMLTGVLRTIYEQERFTARIDPLTGAPNRKGFQEALATEVARHQRKGVGFCLAYIDCDDFKQVNDKFGHAEGDRLLQAIASVSVETLRRSDTIGRLGGDEFAVILPETEQRDALFVIDKLQHKLRAITRLRHWHVSFSIGVAVFQTIPGSATLAMEFADRLMYAAKNQGKGVTVWNVFGDVRTAPVVWHIGVAGSRSARRASAASAASAVSPLRTT
jgi:diguanylate cyclase (GGDEF)-like protein